MLRRPRRLDPNRIIATTVADVAYASSNSLLAEVDYAALDPDGLQEWIASLAGSIRALRKLKTALERQATP